MEQASDDFNDEDYKKLDLYIKGINEIARKVERKIASLEKQKKEIEEMNARMAELTMQSKEKILFNVGGKKFATTKSTLMKHDNYFSGFLKSDIKPDEKGIRITFGHSNLDFVS